MAYHNVRLSPEIERDSRGGPNFFTTIISSPSGNEFRNINWEDDRPRWDISYGIRHSIHLEEVKNHYFGRRGTAHSFPFRDWDDYKSGPNNTDVAVNIAVGDGVTTVVPLVKPYADPINPYFKRIYKPDLVWGVITYVDGIVTAHADLADGFVEFAVAPLLDKVISAKFRYDNPMRYGKDNLMQQLRFVQVKSLPEISLVGVRPPNY